ncbi:MAG: dethiobiotin synthase [Fluviicola sp.]|jgi:dethiobiotin synthetase
MKTGHCIVTGIGTGIGKTVCSAVICEALELDYWKPVQSGDLHALDSDFVAAHTSNTGIIPAAKLLSQPLSPHEAARIDGIKLTEEDFELPQFSRTTLIEGAGGLMVPLNDEGLCYLDVFQHWDLPVYVITRHYLGSINHTLLTLNALYCREIQIAGLIVNGNKNEASERIYRNHFPELHLSYIPEMEELTKASIHAAAQSWKEQLL